MDNRQFDITSEGEKALAMAIRIAWDNAPGGKAVHYKVVKVKSDTRYWGEPTSHHSTNSKEDKEGIPTLILFWSDDKDTIPLPYPLEVEEAIPFINGWLKKAEFGQEPDHDGDNGKGWRVFSDDWGYVAGNRCAILGIQPTWAMYGK